MVVIIKAHWPGERKELREDRCFLGRLAFGEDVAEGQPKKERHRGAQLSEHGAKILYNDINGLGLGED